MMLAGRHENTVHLMFHAPRCSHEAPAVHRGTFLLFLLSTSVEGHPSDPSDLGSLILIQITLTNQDFMTLLTLQSNQDS